MKQIITLFLVLHSVNVFCQNLVPNSSFEIADCNSFGIAFFEESSAALADWFRPSSSGSADFFSSCYNDSWSNLGVPSNIFGFQSARTGESYVGLGTYEPPFEAREFIGCELQNELETNEIYTYKMWVSWSDSSSYKTDRLSVFFSEEPYVVEIDSESGQHVVPPYQIEFLELDTMGNDSWVLLEAEYLATGGERFLTIGEFENNSDINSTFIEQNQKAEYAYFFIDDVSLEQTYTSIIELRNPKEVQVYPTLMKVGQEVNFKSNGKIQSIFCFDQLGREAEISHINSDQLRLSDPAPGLYFLNFVFQSGIQVTKIIVY